MSDDRTPDDRRPEQQAPEAPERVFVLRLGGDVQRRSISLYDADSGDRVYFNSLATLLSHLRRELRELPDQLPLRS